MSNGRATGKTFRAVLKVLVLASEGSKIKFISICNGSKLNAIRLAKEISSGYAESFTHNKIIFPSGGFVLFAKMSELTGGRFNKVVIDDKII